MRNITSNPIQIVDLFSGPGGLGEGFSSFQRQNGKHAYKISVSIEKDIAAHKTLRLRAFLRQFTLLLDKKVFQRMSNKKQGS